MPSRRAMSAWLAILPDSNKVSHSIPLPRGSITRDIQGDVDDAEIDFWLGAPRAGSNIVTLGGACLNESPGDRRGFPATQILAEPECRRNLRFLLAPRAHRLRR